MKHEIKEWFPDVVEKLDAFYAEKANIDTDKWQKYMGIVITNNLYGVGDDYIPLEEAEEVIRKVINILPPGMKSSWHDEGGDEYIEFEVTSKQLNLVYFKEVRSVMSDLPILNE